MEQMITASMGIVKVKPLLKQKAHWNYYLQIITADQYGFYHVFMGESEAMKIARQEGIEIREVEELPTSDIIEGKQ